MEYNMSFLTAALVFLLFILYHFTSQRKIENKKNRLFRFFLYVGIMDVVFDIISSILIMEKIPGTVGLLRLILTIFYMLQAAFPCILLLYITTHRKKIHEQGTAFYLCILPAALMEILVLFNTVSGIFFRVSSEGDYIHGPFYWGMYFCAFFYALLIVADSVLHYREYGRTRFFIIWEFILITVICVGIQAVHNDLLMTGFGLGLGITVLYLSINNPTQYIDGLTGVFNIQGLQEWGEQAMKKGSLHAIAIDLHQLKKINMVLSTDSGDHFLKNTAAMLQDSAETPYIFRTTSKRFIVFTYSLSEYELLLSRIQEFFHQTVQIQQREYQLSAIICGVINAHTLTSHDSLLSYMDYLISLVPASDEAITIQGSESTWKRFQFNKEVERYLPAAIAEDLFEVYYQPVFSLETGDYISLEALSRLHHPSLGYVPPDVFITAAEKNGLITQISYLQFRKICQFVKENIHIMDKIQNIKYNLSPAQFLKSGHIQELADVIHEYGLPGSYFQFEITETVATEYSSKLYEAISIFSKHGIGLCLDDFGSGYANLDTVLKLPFSVIKLDRSLLQGILTSERAVVFYKTIVSVLQNMGYKVVAEGVETQEERDLLEQWGVNMIQGYYFSKPLCEADLLKKLK